MGQEAYNPFDIDGAAPADGGGKIMPMPSVPAQGGTTDPVAVTAETARHGRTLAALGHVYLRHGDAPRSMVLGLAGMAMGDIRPQTVLLVADSMLRAGDPAQALTVLSRFDGAPGLLANAPTPAQVSTRHYLEARALYRLGDGEASRLALDRALAARPAPAPPAAARPSSDDEG